MNKQDVVKILLLLSAEYPREIDPKQDDMFKATADLGYGCFYEESAELGHAAVMESLKKSVFCPRVADIQRYIEELESAGRMSAYEEWEILRRALSKVPYFPHEVNGEAFKALYETLPATIREFYPTPSAVYRLSKADYETLDFDKARFLKAHEQLVRRVKYREESKREQIYGLLPTFGLKKLTDAKREESK
jgi:hypothetical protein